jgi:hypothetical protein
LVLMATIAPLTVAADLSSIVNHVGSHDFASHNVVREDSG